jgi:hypothetical protein
MQIESLSSTPPSNLECILILQIMSSCFDDSHFIFIFFGGSKPINFPPIMVPCKFNLDLPLFGLGLSSKGHGPNLWLSTNRIALFHWTRVLRPSYKVALINQFRCLIQVLNHGQQHSETALVELVVTGSNDVSAHWAFSMVQKCKEEKRKVGQVMQMWQEKLWTTRILTLTTTERIKRPAPKFSSIIGEHLTEPFYLFIYLFIPSAVHVAFQRNGMLVGKWVFHYFILKNTWLFFFFFSTMIPTM